MRVATKGAIRHGFSLIAALLLCEAIPHALHAQAPPPGVFAEVRTAVVSPVSPALEPSTLRSRVVQVDTRKITAARRGREVLRLNLFDDAVVEVAIRRVRPTRTGYFISGTPKGMDWGEVRLVVNGPVMVGTVVTPESKFTVRWDGSGRHVIRQVDPSKERFECEVEAATFPGPTPQPPDFPAISSIDPLPAGTFSLPTQADDMPTEDGSEVRVLVVYTPALQRKQGGAAGVTAFVDLLIQTANQAFEDSGINPRLVLAHAAMVDFVEKGSELRALRDPADGQMDEVHSLRNEHAADLVHLLADSRLSAPGSAARPLSESLAFADSAYYAVTNNDSEETFTHEIGHNFGLKHDRYVNNVGYTIYPYAFGYTNEKALEPDSPLSARWRTIMAYGRRCGDADLICPRLLRFSNPDQTHLGDALGVPADSQATGVDGPADARLAINNSARWVGSFRSEACTEFTIAQEAHLAPLDGGRISIQVDAGIGCVWEASSDAEFITIESDRRQAGSGFATAIVAANETNAERTGTLTVAGKTVTVRQLAVSGGVCNRTTAVMQLITERAGFTDAAQCDQVTDEHLARIGSLDLSDQGTTQLKEGDFDGLTALRHLYLYGNRLTRLPEGLFSGLFELRTLSLEENRIQEVDENLFADLSKLESLNLQRNQIAGLSEDLFATLSKLKHLNLQQNRITGISERLLAGNPQLESLNIGYNDITDLPAGLFEGLPNLSFLDVTSNRIPHLQANLFAKLTSLEVLAMGFNRIEALPKGSFSGLSNLRLIRLNSNRLTVLPAGRFAGLSKLQHLSLGSNRLTVLPADLFADLTALRRLELQSNLISGIPSRLFAGLTNLRILGLEFNRLNHLSPGMFAELGLLEYLNLSANQIAELPDETFAGLSGLERLVLANNRLTHLPAGIFSELTSLRELNLSINSLTSIPDGVFADLPQLDSLYLSRNSIDPLPLTVSLQQERETEFKAIVPAAAPFSMDLPIVVSGGTIEGGTTTVNVPAGSMESRMLRVGRETGSVEPVSVNLGALPTLPNDHVGYVIEKDESLPLRVLHSSLPNDTQLIHISLDEGELDPVFSADVKNYSALVAHDVSTLTISPTPSNGRAAVAFRDVGDEALADANAIADGHQVDLLVGRNTINVIVTSEDGTHTATYELLVTRDGAADGCVRSRPVRLAILAAIPGTDACSQLTSEELAAITKLDLSSKEISSLEESDLAGLVSLEELNLRNNELRTLPSEIFSDLENLQSIRLELNELRSLPESVFSSLSSLEFLRIDENRLVSLPSGIFSDLSSLATLNLSRNRLTSLPADVFNGLTNLSELSLYLNRLTDLPAGIFSDLTALRALTLYDNSLLQLRPDMFSGLYSLKELFLGGNDDVTDLPPGIFDELPALERLGISGLGLTVLREGIFSSLRNLREISLGDNELKIMPADIFAGLSALQRLSIWRTEITSLPEGLFSDLKSLRELQLSHNKLSELPTGILAGITSLNRLNLRGNVVDPLPLPITLQKVGNSQFKAVAPTGAPFTLNVPVHVSESGQLNDGINEITIPSGAIESPSVEVTRVAGSEEAVIVNVGELPDLPDRHEGYFLQPDATLPKTILPGPEDPPPAQVTNVQITPGPEQLEITWASARDAGGYKVQWKSGDEDYDESRQSLLSGGDMTSHTITGLVAGTDYTVRVIATRQQADDGAPSEEVIGVPVASPPSQVTGVAVVPGADELEVTWNAASDADGYKVQWKSGAEEYAEGRQVALLGVATTSYTIIDLTTDTEYTIRVIATREHADDGEPSGEVTGTPANLDPDPDVNADGTLNGDDAQVMYQAYASAERVGDGDTGGTAESRRTLLSGLAGVSDPSDKDLKAMLRKANVWKVVGLGHGGDINEDGAIDGDDAFVMYYAYEFADLVGDGETGGTARHRRHLLASRAGQDDPSDEDLKKMLRRANKLKEDFG